MRSSLHLNRWLELNTVIRAVMAPIPHVCKMAGLCKYFKPALPSKESTGIGEQPLKKPTLL